MSKKMLWGGRRYKSFDFMIKEKFGEKLYKLALDGGMSCPNRDGKISYGGCIFCSNGGSGDFAARLCGSVDEQLSRAKELVKNKYNGSGYIAYFQAYTNTYADVSYLEQLFEPIVEREDIKALSIATRPDCLPEDVVDLIERLNKIKPVWVELGLQTVSEKTAKLINRGYDLACYDDAIKKLRKTGAEIITHMIIGLPNETKNDILKTAEYIGKTADGIKLQLLHVLKNTRLAQMYFNKEFSVLTMEEYVSITADIISILPQNITIHRLTGDGKREELIAPLWSLEKMRVLNAINHELKARDLWQGKYNNEISQLKF